MLGEGAVGSMWPAWMGIAAWWVETQSSAQAALRGVPWACIFIPARCCHNTVTSDSASHMPEPEPPLWSTSADPQQVQPPPQGPASFFAQKNFLKIDPFLPTTSFCFCFFFTKQTEGPAVKRKVKPASSVFFCSGLFFFFIFSGLDIKLSCWSLVPSCQPGRTTASVCSQIHAWSGGVQRFFHKPFLKQQHMQKMGFYLFLPAFMPN